MILQIDLLYVQIMNDLLSKQLVITSYSIHYTKLYEDGNRTFSYVVVVITSLVTLFFSGLLFMLLNLMVRGEAKYMQLVTVAAFASLPGMIDGILTAILLKVTNAHAINDISLSLGAFIQDKGSILFKALSIINPFSIWTLVLYIIRITSYNVCYTKLLRVKASALR